MQLGCERQGPSLAKRLFVQDNDSGLVLLVSHNSYFFSRLIGLSLPSRTMTRLRAVAFAAIMSLALLAQDGLVRNRQDVH